MMSFFLLAEKLSVVQTFVVVSFLFSFFRLCGKTEIFIEEKKKYEVENSHFMFAVCCTLLFSETL
jgi:hypothetical protein